MRRRPRPHATRKMKRRELLDQISHSRKVISTLKERIVQGCAYDMPSPEPERLDVQTLKAEFTVPYHADPANARARAVERIGRDLDDRGLIETLATMPSPSYPGTMVCLRLRVIHPQQR